MGRLSATDPDWSREHPQRFWDPSRRLLRAHRHYNKAAQGRGLLSALRQRRWVLSHRFWSIVTGAEIPLDAKIGGGLLIPHPNGIVIHSHAVIGPNCLIFHQVTIGQNHKVSQPPIIEGHVDIGAGAKIIGPITVQAHSMVGANSVVTKSVARGDIVAGIPAKKVGNTLESSAGQGKQ